MSEYKSFFKKVGGNEGQKCRYSTRLDTYGCGCAHDCNYCYAKSLLDFRRFWNPQKPKVANIEKIAAKIATLVPYSVVRLGGMTDCFQPCELEYRVTYETIKLLNEHKVQYLIVTKSDMVARDEYLNILDSNLAHIQISITSTDDAFAATYEKATPPSLRIQAIEKLQKAGYDVQTRISPYISEFINFDILNRIKCKKAIIEFLRVNHYIKSKFKIDFSKFTHLEAGYQHLELEEKIRLLGLINGFEEISVCEDCSEAFEYWKKYQNPNAIDCCNLRF